MKIYLLVMVYIIFKERCNMNIAEDTSPIEQGYEKEALEFILENAFNSGFGTLNKSELDLILFSAILKYSDQKLNSDFELSKYLQITQQRVRNLKEKASVKYLSFSREEAINTFVDKVQYSKVNDIFFDIPIYDIRVKNELEAILEENNILLHTQLNEKIFRIRIDDFLEFCIIIESESNPDTSVKEVEKNIIKFLQERSKEDQDFAKKIAPESNSWSKLTKETVKKSIVRGGLHFGIDVIASLIPGGALLSTPIKSLLTAIQGKV